MKKILLVLFFVISALPVLSNEVNVYFEKTDTGYNIFADNQQYSTMSVKLDFELQNLEVVNKQEYYLLQPGEKKRLLTELKIDQPGKPVRLSYKYASNYGNHGLKDYDTIYPYFLPFQKGGAFQVFQGYNGSFSHYGKNALDFTMPVGTEILAIREGVVVKVEERNNRSCAKRECMKFNNYVMVQHPDGTFSQYVHIKQNGALVEPGDRVEKGQLIALSGNVGYSTGPHLHLEIFIQRLEEREYLKTQFLINKGEMAEVLQEKFEYRREY